ncbi:ABC transporter permease [Methyloceanibacter sp.]|uniref:cell division protein FtsX n=1 Tax=Methyloceanibacter sp. TaxID=1965321 RepID=UPI002C0D5FF2|nr:ABC transporter permease [Methyloceanibacter sp.]HML93117.1 ABC transporter permease [Methyloceanibacter sp.]
MSFLSDIKDYPWTSLLAGILPSRIAARLPERFQAPSSQIVPPASVAGRALTVVIAIMTFLACLTAGGVYMVHQSASAWVDDIASEITIELNPLNTADVEKKMTLVALFLAKQPGVTRVTPMSADDSAKLLEPWLGSTAALSALPVPRLIAVEIDRSNPPDMKVIESALNQNFEGVTLDDHRRWQSEIKTITRSTALGGIVVLGLVAAATVAVIISATRSAMATNRGIIEVLHFVGANDRFISSEFERHFLGLGVRAGLAGALAAAVTFLLLPFLLHLLGGGAVTEAETRRLLGTGELDIWGYLLLVVIVVVVAALCTITSRLGVFRVLKSYA